MWNHHTDPFSQKARHAIINLRIKLHDDPDLWIRKIIAIVPRKSNRCVLLLLSARGKYVLWHEIEANDVIICDLLNSKLQYGSIQLFYRFGKKIL